MDTKWEKEMGVVIDLAKESDYPEIQAVVHSHFYMEEPTQYSMEMGTGTGVFDRYYTIRFRVLSLLRGENDEISASECFFPPQNLEMDVRRLHDKGTFEEEQDKSGMSGGQELRVRKSHRGQVGRSRRPRYISARDHSSRTLILSKSILGDQYPIHPLLIGKKS